MTLNDLKIENRGFSELFAIRLQAATRI